MPLPNETVAVESDPIRYTDLTRHETTSLCPNCGNDIAQHNRDNNSAEHDHMEIDAHRLCRQLIECNIVTSIRQIIPTSQLYYVYNDLENQNLWTNVKVIELSKEEVDDSEVVTISRKKLAEPLKPKWRFKTKLGTKEDYTEYFARNLVIGLEVELDWKGRAISEEQMQHKFGISPSPYHEIGRCQICGNNGCWNHSPENLIRAIESDSSIKGWEFVIYGNNVPSEEFAKRLPIQKLKENFMPTEKDSLHTHALLVHDVRPIPNVIAKNLWQLFRYFYPAWVNVFGNYPASQGFLRRSDYAHFAYFNRSPFMPRWGNDLNKHDNNGARAALFFCNTPVRTAMMTSFDVEIRTPDATVDVEQLVAVRALTKAIILRAAQLSNFGLMSVESNKEEWEMVKLVTSKLNARLAITKQDEDFMQKHTVKFVREVTGFLSDFERQCIKNLIEKPVRTRGENIATQEIVHDMSDLAKQLKKLITIADIEAKSRDDWIAKVARLMSVKTEDIYKALGEFKAYYDVHTSSMAVNA
jgi:hypothetical protein